MGLDFLIAVFWGGGGAWAAERLRQIFGHPKKDTSHAFSEHGLSLAGAAGGLPQITVCNWQLQTRNLKARFVHSQGRICGALGEARASQITVCPQKACRGARGVSQITVCP